MFAVAIFCFLAGAVLAWAYRVWILVPATLLAAIATLVVAGFSHAGSFFATVGQALLVGLFPQLGYCFGLLARHTLVAMRVPLTADPRSMSVASLYRQRLFR